MYKLLYRKRRWKLKLKSQFKVVKWGTANFQKKIEIRRSDRRTGEKIFVWRGDWPVMEDKSGTNFFSLFFSKSKIFCFAFDSHDSFPLEIRITLSLSQSPTRNALKRSFNSACVMRRCMRIWLYYNAPRRNVHVTRTRLTHCGVPLKSPNCRSRSPSVPNGSKSSFARPTRATVMRRRRRRRSATVPCTRPSCRRCLWVVRTRFSLHCLTVVLVLLPPHRQSRKPSVHRSVNNIPVSPSFRRCPARRVTAAAAATTTCNWAVQIDENR